MSKKLINSTSYRDKLQALSILCSKEKKEPLLHIHSIKILKY